MNERPRYYRDVETCVEETLSRIGRRIMLGTPLGLGKANHLVNEFFRRARADSGINLHIFTALSLGVPQWKGELERRLVEPLSKRLFGDYPELEYLDFVRQGKLPKNIRVSEFYFQPGSFLDSPLAQQSYMCSNYTHVVRDLVSAGINVLAQLVGKMEENGAPRYSLSCNSDITLDLVPRVREAKSGGARIELLGQVNPNLPFMFGDASVAASYFDAIVDSPKYTFPLFGPPNRPVDTVEYLIALHVTALIRDGGTLQIGIGALEDAVTNLLKLRHQQNDLYREILNEAGILEHFGKVIERLGSTDPFEEGLYASSEMLVDGFLELYRSGILRRRVYGHVGLQRLLNEGRIGEDVTLVTLDALIEAGIISTYLTEQDFTFLQQFGILKPELRYETGVIFLNDGNRIPASLTNDNGRAEITRHCLGTRLNGGHFAHACFFLGPQKFYETLRQMDRCDREQICMTGISYVNELYGYEELKRLQRKSARFVNTGLIATLTGAVASDGLDNGRVLSGVGGQYNFVAMAHELEDGRSILMIRSTKEEDGKVRSNIRWSYDHVTIPRHLRDIVVTEYGIADLRGRTDEEVITALLEIADSRFQGALAAEAKRAGKISQDYRIPDHARNNRPEQSEALLRKYRERELFKAFPFGTDLTEQEVVLRKALLALKQSFQPKKLRLPRLEEIQKTLAIPDSARPYLERMMLDRPQSLKERLLQRALTYALACVDAI
ncbi:MAG TPA: acetyl-CoA hydrolase/transferase C-terminal domain-containing protein [Pyrinomonadaceae bacterium]|jgi:acyl-CoA hydrolase|nr:acetyl-CoA hydrolase/transferase C-terminal domain-containing protein [Pyrinomonadaceae bacterium]